MTIRYLLKRLEQHPELTEIPKFDEIMEAIRAEEKDPRIAARFATRVTAIKQRRRLDVVREPQRVTPSP